MEEGEIESEKVQDPSILEEPAMIGHDTTDQKVSITWRWDTLRKSRPKVKMTKTQSRQYTKRIKNFHGLTAADDCNEKRHNFANNSGTFGKTTARHEPEEYQTHRRNLSSSFGLTLPSRRWHQQPSTSEVKDGRSNPEEIRVYVSPARCPVRALNLASNVRKKIIYNQWRSRQKNPIGFHRTYHRKPPSNLHITVHWPV